MDVEHPHSEAQNSPDSSDQPIPLDSTADPSVASGSAEAQKNDANATASKSTGLIVGVVVVVVALILVGLFLPPISLGERLGLTGGSSSAEVDTDQVVSIILDNGEKAKIKVLNQSDFLNQAVGDDWVEASSSVPANLTLVSDVYALSFKDEAPTGVAEIKIPPAAQPHQTLDLYGWGEQGWIFIPSEVDAAGSSLFSAPGQLPTAVALMQTSKPDQPAIGAEILPAHQLPQAVTPFVNEVIAGTLTLGQNGELLGEVVNVPPGNYRQYLRATNTGVFVDVGSLSSLLSDAATMESHIQELVSRAKSGGFAGVNLDYQGATPEQRVAFSSFVSQLASSLHENGLELLVTLESPVFDNGQWDTAGHDWQVIGRTADVVYLQMPLEPVAYADNGEAEQVLGWATRHVNRSKLSALVSVHAVDSVGESSRELEGNTALTNFGELEFIKGSSQLEPGETVELALSGSAGPLEWDADGLTYRYSYEQAGQPHEVWLGSEAVLSHQGRLPNRYNVRGLAVRGLGELTQAEGYATALENYLGTAESPQPASAAIVWAVEDASGGVVASSSGDSLSFAWEGTDQPGTYTVRAEFAHGDKVASLGSVELQVIEQEPVPEEPEEVVVEEETPTPAATAIVQAAAVDPGDADAVANTPANIRKGPGLAYPIIGGINTGERVSLTGRNADKTWYQIKMADGGNGWVFAQLLTLNSTFDANALAVVEVDPPESGGGGAAPAPVIAPAAGGSFELGGQTHTLANPTLMKMAGMNWVKFQHKWGPGDGPDAVAGRIQQAHANGFKVLLSIPGANSYPSSIDFNSYVEFLRGVARQGPDAIEIWNEENIDFEWPAGNIDPTSYVNNMLAPAYNAIKSANPSVMVISGAPAPTGFDNGTNAWSDQRYMAGVAAAGGANYMDCIGVHHNAGATSPNTASGHPAGNNHYSWYFWPTLNMYYNSFGGARPVCFTELGFLSGEDFGGVPSRFSWASGTSVSEHAQWLAEAASLSANSGKVRLLIVFNVDFTHWSEDPQAGYAMLRPNGSCPSCTLLGQVMGR